MRKKLIEVALPLEAINRESAREKSIRHGHPSTLHLWWARRPLAACRAVLFASLVDDPSSLPEEFPTEELQEQERQRLFRIIEELVKWDNSNNERVLDAARNEILKSTDGNPPPVLDPFCGGGSIPLEAQRLGLEAHGSDLNPVAVLITKALIEIPPKFANQPPVNPDSRKKLSTHAAKWRGAQGLAEDVRYYGKWMRDEAETRIGHLYPKVQLEDGHEATVIAWLWARTVKCPNPACGVEAPLIRSFQLSTKKGNECWVRPRIDRTTRRVWFDVETAASHPLDADVADRGAAYVNDLGKKTKAKFRCVACEIGTIDGEYVDREADVGRMSAIPLAIVAESNRKRVYRAAVDAPVQLRAIDAASEYASRPSVTLKFPHEPARGTFAGNAQGRIYGFKKFADYFTPRQLVALTTFCDLVAEARGRVLAEAKKTMSNDGVRLANGGTGADAYADAVSTYLAFAVDKMTDTNSSLCSWQVDPPRLRATFGRQAIPMVWDFAEANPFGGAAGDYELCVGSLSEVLDRLAGGGKGEARQLDATAERTQQRLLVSTDPPYYDNIGYADLSDYFYVWLRRSLSTIYPDLFSTLLVPKKQELIASPYRFEGSKDAAKSFFEAGLSAAFVRLHELQDDRFPLSVYYAFKQAEDDGEDTGSASTGWETMLEALIGAGFSIHGTWPVRSEMASRNVGRGTNALASSVVLIARSRPSAAAIATRREFIAALKSELPAALRGLQHSSIAAVDLAQATIGPGMGVFSRYAKVIESDGSPMRVRSALQLINQALDELLSAQESDYDADTQWAVAWFDQFGMDEAAYGDAETLSKAKNTSVRGMEEAGIVTSAKGKVRLLARETLADDWDPATDSRLTIWEVTQQLIRRLQSGGEQEAAELLRKVGGMGEVARDLAYRLYQICDRKGRSEEAIAYNALVVAWPEITKLASERPAPPAGQQSLL